MATTDTSTEAGALAGTLFIELLAGTDFTIPNVDLSSPDFEIPDLEEVIVTPLTEADLTSRNVDGTGLFDGLMEAMRGHLQIEFEKGRLTGAQYAEAYISMTSTAMGAAVQYLLSKDQARWQAALIQRQAQIAGIGVVKSRVELEEVKVRLGIAQVDALTQQTNYALTKLKLATEDAQWANLKAQLDQTEYTTTSLLPAQLADLNMGVAVKTAQRDQVLYETSSILPKQADKLVTEEAVLSYQLSALYPAQVAGHTADTAGKEYNNQFILPAQLESVREQTEGHRAKTLDTRTDGTTVSGTVGKQKDLYDQQIISYQRDAETKVVRMMVDSWITQKTMDEGLTAPSALNNTGINGAFTTLLGNVSL